MLRVLLLLCSAGAASAFALRAPTFANARTGRAVCSLGSKKDELIAAIAQYKEAIAEDGVPIIDFGVSGGELDSDSRAPRDLLAAGAYHAVSQRVGEAADRVVRLVDALASENPTRCPTASFGTPAGAEVCPLHGEWSNMFTTAADATFSADSKRGDAAVSNVVDAVTGRTINVIQFSPRDEPAFRATRSEPLPPPLESLKVVLSAKAISESRVELVFRRVRARLNLRLFGRRFGLTLILPVPGPFFTRLAFLFRPKKRPPPAYFDILYLDGELRVHRTGQGNIFVQQRRLAAGGAAAAAA
jgi:hypothetical protein